jgi:hypothetical protein
MERGLVGWRVGSLGNLMRRLPWCVCVCVCRMAGTDSLLRPGGKISIAEALKLPLEVYEYPHSVLLAASMSGDYEAREEVLRRHIMVVDKVGWLVPLVQLV